MEAAYDAYRVIFGNADQLTERTITSVSEAAYGTAGSTGVASSKMTTDEVLKLPPDEFPLAIQQARKDARRSGHDDYSWIKMTDPEGGISGICGYALKNGEPYLYAVEISAHSYGTGLGKQLMNLVTTELRNSSYSRVSLHPMCFPVHPRKS